MNDVELLIQIKEDLEQRIRDGRWVHREPPSMTLDRIRQRIAEYDARPAPVENASGRRVGFDTQPETGGRYVEFVPAPAENTEGPRCDGVDVIGKWRYYCIKPAGHDGEHRFIHPETTEAGEDESKQQGWDGTTGEHFYA